MRNVIVTLVLLCASAALFSLPAVYYLNTAAVGGPESDVWNSLWLMWAVPAAMVNPQLSLGDFSLLVDPAGVDLWPHLGNALLPLIMSPITLSLGPGTAANLALIVALFLNVLFAYLFLRVVVGDHGAALPPALAFGVGTFVLSEAGYGNVELAGVFVLPLAAWAVVRAGDAPSWRHGLFVAMALVLAALWNAYYGMAAFVFAVLAAVWATVDDKSKAPLWTIGGGVLAAALALSPLAVALAGHVDAAQPAGGWTTPGAQLDLLEPFYLARDYPDTVPYFLLIVGLIGLVRHRKQTFFWWMAAVVLFVFSLGPSLHVLGGDTGNPGPYRLLAMLPGMERARWPYRFIIMAHLCLAVSAAWALRGAAEFLEQRGLREEGKLTAIAVLLALTMSFFLTPHPAVATAVPDAYGALHEAGEGAVLELPVHADVRINARYLYYQTVHRHSVLVGQPLPDRPEGLPPAVLAQAPSLTPLNSFPPDVIALAMVDDEQCRAELRDLGVHYVVWHPYDAPENVRPLLEAWIEQTFGGPLRRDRATVVYLIK